MTTISSVAEGGVPPDQQLVRASLFGPNAPRFTGKICYRSVIPSTPSLEGSTSTRAPGSGRAAPSSFTA